MIEITPLLLIPFLVWVVAQGIKFSLALIRGEFDLRYLFASGGMPSVHSAVVCALAATALIEYGARSPFFGIAAVYAGIVMYDSFGVRRAAGEQAHALNTLLEELTERGSIADRARYGKLREVLGHKPTEVTAGAALGIVAAILMEYNKTSPYVRFLAAVPTHAEFQLYLVIAVVLLLMGLAAWVGQRKRKTARATALRHLGSLNVVAGILLFVVSLCQFEQINLLSGRGLSWIVGLTWLGWSSTFIYRNQELLRAKPNINDAGDRRERWLKRAKRIGRQRRGA